MKGRGVLAEPSPHSQKLASLHAEACASISEGQRAGRRRFHVVAPAGSEKQRLAAALVESMRCRTLILARNKAVLSSWEQKYSLGAESLAIAASSLRQTKAVNPVSAMPYSCAPVLTLSYTGFAGAAFPGESIEHYDRFIRHLVKYDYKLILLDSCEDLPEVIAQALELFARDADSAVLALSPDRYAAQHSQPASLFSREIDFEYEIPALIKAGAVHPFRSFTSFVHPTETERRTLQTAHNAVLNALHALDGDGENSASFSEWLRAHPLPASQQIRDHDREYLGALGQLASLLEQRDDGEILCTCLTPDMLAQMLLEYRATLSPESRSGATAQALAEAIKTGVLRNEGDDIVYLSGARRACSASTAKLETAVEILKEESRLTGKDLRSIILLDTTLDEEEGTHASEFETGLFEAQCAALFTRFRMVKELETLPALAADGLRLICASHLSSMIESELRRIFARRTSGITMKIATDDNLCVIAFSGEEWNSREYAFLLSELLLQKRILCLIAPRSLFVGPLEQLDAEVVITVSASRRGFLPAVREPMRAQGNEGRDGLVIREIVCLEGGALFGAEDLCRLRDKYALQWLPAEGNVMVQGISGLLPTLWQHWERLRLSDAATAERELQNVATDRHIHKRWQEALEKGQRTSSYASVGFGDGHIPALACEAVQREALASAMQKFGAIRHDLRIFLTVGGAAAAGAVLVLFLLLPLMYAVPASAFIGAGFLAVVLIRWLRRLSMKAPEAAISSKDALHRLGNALAAFTARNTASSSTPPAVSFHQIVNASPSLHAGAAGPYRLCLTNQYREAAAAFANALCEVLQKRDVSAALAVFAYDFGKTRLRTIMRKKSVEKYFKPSFLIPLPREILALPEEIETFRLCVEHEFGKTAFISADADPTLLKEIPLIGALLDCTVRQGRCTA